MIPLQIKQIAEITTGKLFNVDDSAMTINAITIDSRKVTPNSLFIALKGDHFDGHVFALQAIKTGAVAVIVEHEVVDQLVCDSALPVKIPQIVVDDSRLALGQIAAYVRSKMATKVVALTGSSGKTSVKEMTATILQECGETLYTQGNFNNDIGVPLTLLRLTPNDQFAVIELGANHIGEIAYTTQLVKPQTVLINNIAAAHIEGFGSLEGVAKAKAEIFEGLVDDGIAIINLDSCSDKWFTQFEQSNNHKKMWTFSLTNPKANFYATDITTVPTDHSSNLTRFTLQTPNGNTVIELSLAGQHNISNAIAASALALSVGASFSEISAGLSKLKPVKGRLYPIRLNSDQLIYDDSYNANMGSMSAAIRFLATQPGYRVLVVGDMAELGANSENYHKEIGKLTEQVKIDSVITIGQLSQLISQNRGHHFLDKKSVADFLFTLLQQHDKLTILVKGSRSAKMEEVIEQLLTLIKDIDLH